MPKMQVTEAEAELVKRERHRLSLESKNWNDEPHVDDKDLMIMSPGFVLQRFLSNPNMWIYSLCEQRFINITHPGNMNWYMEYLMSLCLAGEIAPEAMHERLTMSKVYTQTGGTHDQLREYQTKFP